MFMEGKVLDTPRPCERETPTAYGYARARVAAVHENWERLGHRVRISEKVYGIQ